MPPEKRDSGHPSAQKTSSGPPLSATSKKKARRTFIISGRSISLPGQMQIPFLASDSQTIDAIKGNKQTRKRKKQSPKSIAEPSD